jgi:hypothetical protein
MVIKMDATIRDNIRHEIDEGSRLGSAAAVGRFELDEGNVFPSPRSQS